METEKGMDNLIPTTPTSTTTKNNKNMIDAVNSQQRFLFRLKEVNNEKEGNKGNARRRPG